MTSLPAGPQRRVCLERMLTKLHPFRPVCRRVGNIFPFTKLRVSRKNCHKLETLHVYREWVAKCKEREEERSERGERERGREETEGERGG